MLPRERSLRERLPAPSAGASSGMRAGAAPRCAPLRRCEVAACRTAPLRGALCGGLAAGVYPDGEAAVAAVAGAAHGIIIEPDPALVARYRAIFEQVYQQAYGALRPLNHAIAALG